FHEYGSLVPSSVRSLQASGLAIDATINGPSHLLYIFPFCLAFGILRSTKSPSLIFLGFTFLFLHLRVSSWYLPKLIAACILTASIVSIEGLMSSSMFSASSAVLQDLSFISSGVTASSPYRSLNGVNFVVLDSVVLCDKITLDNLSIHFPFG